MSNKYIRGMDKSTEPAVRDAHLSNTEDQQAISLGLEKVSTANKVKTAILGSLVVAGVLLGHDSSAPGNSPDVNTDQNVVNPVPASPDQIYTNHEGDRIIEIPQIPGASDGTGTTPKLGTPEQIKSQELPNGNIQE